MKTLAQQFGEYVRERRRSKGLSQVVFAEQCGFYQTYLSRIETGKANPTLNAMVVISGALGVTIFDVFDDIKARADRAY